jgi:hypothetical protein
MNDSFQCADDRHVFQIAFPRTGTKSLAVAMRTLGYRVYLGPMKADDEYEVCAAYLDGTFHESSIPQRYEYIGQACPWYRELDEQFPDAKFIMLQRPVEQWVASWQRLCRKAGARRVTSAARRGEFDSSALHRLLLVRSVAFNSEVAGNCYDTYVTNVNNYFCSRYPGHDDKFMRMWIADGWNPLCRFLNCELPTIAFPWEFSAGTIRRIAKNQMKKQLR